MRAVGLITEYNPFHNGHLHHLEQSKQLADAEVSVAVMSGNFLQRGEPALCDKWWRTEMALAAGVDLVVEIPYIFACNSAPCFAQGAIETLAGIGGIEALCFGSELGSLAALQTCAELMLENAAEIERQTQKLFRQGRTYPAARAEILAKMLPDPSVAEVLASPNNILGIEYLKALRQTDSTIKALTVQRLGAGYNDLQASGTIASATGIRHLLKDRKRVDALIPGDVDRILSSAMNAESTPDSDIFLRLLLVRILRGAESLAGIYQVEHGLENRLFEAAVAATNLEGLIAGVKARQLTRTRIQRLLCHVLNEVEAAQAQKLIEQGPVYLHLLGTSQQGEAFLAASRKLRRLPLINNYSRIHNQLQRFYGRDTRLYQLALTQLQLELRSADNYALLQRGFAARRQSDFFEPARRQP